MHVVVAHSEDPESAAAVAEILLDCHKSLDGIIPQAGLLYAGIDHDFQVILNAIMTRYPELELIGCTTDGELSSTIGFSEDSLVLMLLQSERVQFKAGVGQGAKDAPEAAASEAVAMAKAGLNGPIKLCIANPAGLWVDPYKILSSLAREIGNGITICGGFAADQMRLEQTWQFYKSSVYADSVPIMLVAGAVHFSSVFGTGHRPIGEPHQVTKTDGLTVFEIDNKPARDFCLEYYGSLEFSVNTALAVYASGEAAKKRTDDFYISGPLEFFDDGSLNVAFPIPEGYHICHAQVTREELLGGASSAITLASGKYTGKEPDAALIFSCAARHQLLGSRVSEEAALVQEHIGRDLPTIGFYTFGEICPLPNGLQQSHSSTFVSVLIGEG